MQTAEYSSEDNVLIKLGELNTDGHIDGRHPDDPNWKAFKIGQELRFQQMVVVSKSSVRRLTLISYRVLDSLQT